MPELATTLDDLYKALSPEPLMTPEEIAAFYRGEVNAVRGDDLVARFHLALTRAFGGLHYKAFLMGHPGVGKSTELTRLIHDIDGQYSAIRFSATKELDPSNFKPFDVLLLMMAQVAEETAKPKKLGGAGQKPSARLLQDIWQWFATETKTLTQTTEIGAEVEAGAGLESESWWAKMLGLFAHVKGEMKFASDRKKEIVEYRLSRLSTLIELVNRLLDECNSALRKAANKEWLFIGEDFDKPGVSVTLVEDLFLTYANIFKSLRTHLIFTIPVALGYSQQGLRLPCPTLSIPDTPVYRADHTPHAEGRSAIRAVLEARVSPQLFESSEMTRLIVASGGNLRDLFSLVTEAGDNAILGDSPDRKIRKIDADSAIDKLRLQYTARLGDSPYDVEKIPYEEKATRLLAIHHQDPNASIPDAVLYSLLRSRTVQEFNGKGRYGVPPLVVDILKSQGRLSPESPGGSD